MAYTTADLERGKRQAAAGQTERDTLIDWDRVRDAVRGGTRRAADAAIDAALQRPAPPAPPVIVRDGSGGNSGDSLKWLLGLALAGLAFAAMRR